MKDETLRDRLVRSLSAAGEKTAISFYRDDSLETEIPYHALGRDVHRAAQVFSAMGVAKGDRVALYLEKSLCFIVGHLAVQKIGAVSVPLNPGFKASELEYVLGNAEAALVLCGPDQEPRVRRADPGAQTMVVDTRRPYQELDWLRPAPEVTPEARVGPDDPGVIMYTSGTTGTPKGAVLTQGNLVHDARNIIDVWEMSAADVLCHALPLFHVHGLCFALHTALLTGAHVLMLDRFSPQRVVEHLTRSEGQAVCSVFMAVPRMYARLMAAIGEEKPAFDHVRLFVSGSAPLPADDFERIRRVFGREPLEREGMTETGVNFSNPYRGKRKPGTVGLPLPRLGVRVVDPETFEDLAPGGVGELWLRGPSITPGYWRKPEETARAFRDGWFRTGDLGKADEDGYYTITDRLKDIVISGGENISPKEVQWIINLLPGVVESAVVGIPDDEWGEKVVAAVVTAEQSRLDPGAIRTHCKQHLQAWKCPKEIRLVPELPRNTMGKVVKAEVKKLFR